MTRDQHLEFCRRCTNREFNPQLGVICGLTKKIADFENNCENFQVDESVKVEAPVAEPLAGYQVVGDLSKDVKDKLRVQQDLVYAIIGGLSAAIVSALIWALITVSIKYQIGYMSIAVGLIVGFSVRFFGAGIDYIFGFVGGFFAILGCALGNLLSQVAFIADAESLSYFDVLTLLNIPIVVSIFEDSFSPIDILFYGIAAYEGYKFAFRNIPDQVIKSSSTDKLEPLPYSNLRLPIVLVLFVGLSVTYYFVQRGTVGIKTFSYASGAKMSEGYLEHGIENGLWNFWWENGNLQQIGYFKNGNQDSLWMFYNEDGVLYRKGSFIENLQHGEWIDYHPSGQISGSGNFAMGRQTGPWVFYFEDGSLSQKGAYKLDRPDGTWEVYFENGKMNSKGSFEKSEPKGMWTYWYEDGTKSLELEYSDGENFRILNSWSDKGKQLVKDGNGIHIDTYPTGETSEIGTVTNGIHTGIWKKYTIDGKLLQTGEFRNGLYYIIDSWTVDGEPQVKKGEGTYVSYYDDFGNVEEQGKISGGLRIGEWEMLYPNNGGTMLKSNYELGKLNGKYESFFENGEVSATGKMTNGKRDGEWKWFQQNGSPESDIVYNQGLKEGVQSFYDTQGNLTHYEVYKNGELVEAKLSGE